MTHNKWLVWTGKSIVQNALEALKKSKPELKLIGISSSDIIDGKPAIVLGFV